ncbi:winged helix-turn-helix domain-containing protein [Lentibacter algarum]|uniref:ArsR/SmtB family transcription factor n=1 Tax=Lentibacter algarum TaxID=576131 RepID=UPI001C06EB28|nr:winged helix-turn-helix domain-containing protein [Lentibacter algarum]MBU2981232.1 winged helix-turn-helix domain-containing protein [Lentibacter algarum]
METDRLDILGDALAHPSRARMLTALMDGRAFTNKELATYAAITPQTATAHLDRLEYAGLITRLKSGRHAYHRIASEDVASALEMLSTLTANPLPASTPPELRRARSCYNHLAGRLAIEITTALTRKKLLLEENGNFAAQPSAIWGKLGVTLPERPRKQPFAKCCLDWSERKHHIAGPMGTALLENALAERWVMRPKRDARFLEITPLGRSAFAELLDISADRY